MLSLTHTSSRSSGHPVPAGNFCFMSPRHPRFTDLSASLPLQKQNSPGLLPVCLCEWYHYLSIVLHKWETYESSLTLSFLHIQFITEFYHLHFLNIFIFTTTILDPTAACPSTVTRLDSPNSLCPPTPFTIMPRMIFSKQNGLCHSLA